MLKVSRSRYKFAVVYTLHGARILISAHHTARHETLHKLHLIDISSDHTGRDRCLYAHSIQNVNNCELTTGTAHF
jgi:hypothetical protein